MRNELYSFIGGYLSESNIGLKDIVFAAGCLMACMMIAMLIIIIRQAMLMKKYKKFMQGSDARSLEEELRDRMNIIDIINLEL